MEKALKATDVTEIQEPLIAALGDGGYDTRIIYSLCKKLGIVPLVKVRQNANSRANGVDRARALAAQDQLCGEKPDPKELASLDRDERARNQKKWKEKVGYGRRWLVEIVFSSFKRRFGDSVRARTMKNIINEIGIKIKIYNRLLDIAQEAILKAHAKAAVRDFCPLKDRALRFLRERAPSMPEEELIPCGWRVSMLGARKSYATN